MYTENEFDSHIDVMMNLYYSNAMLKIGVYFDNIKDCEALALLICESYHQEEPLGLKMFEILKFKPEELYAITDDRKEMEEVYTEQLRNQF